jgi:hypothetical protein
LKQDNLDCKPSPFLSHPRRHNAARLKMERRVNVTCDAQDGVWRYTVGGVPKDQVSHGLSTNGRGYLYADSLRITRHTSHVTRHTSHVTRHTSHVTRHTSHVTRHTSRHTSHVKSHALILQQDVRNKVLELKARSLPLHSSSSPSHSYAPLFSDASFAAALAVAAGSRRKLTKIFAAWRQRPPSQQSHGQRSTRET